MNVYIYLFNHKYSVMQKFAFIFFDYNRNSAYKCSARLCFLEFKFSSYPINDGTADENFIVKYGKESG